MLISTWIIIILVTGMFILELESCRIRSFSFRYNRDGTFGFSLVGSRSNFFFSSFSIVVLFIFKLRFFSFVVLVFIGGSYFKRFLRKSVVFNMGIEVSGIFKLFDFI